MDLKKCTCGDRSSWNPTRVSNYPHYLTCPQASKKNIFGYHTTEIQKGDIGESSKILEEVLELLDAEKQGAKLMALLECADIIGAIEEYILKHHSNYSLEDLIKMKDITKRAFQNGQRK